jgi:hypothetical protein
MALSINESGLHTSARHFQAKNDGKFTAGDLATILKKELKVKVKASDLKYFANEWHHSGFYGAKGKKTMGKTYFFTEDEVSEIKNNWVSQYEPIIIKKEADLKVKTETNIKGFYYIWDYDYSGRYGKKVNFKRLKTYEGNLIGKPNNFTTLTNDDDFLCAKCFENKAYRGWDEPKSEEFTKEIHLAEINRLEAIKQADILRDIERLKQQELIKTQKIEAMRLLEEMRICNDFSNVDFANKNASWHIYQKFFQGKNENVSCGIIKDYIFDFHKNKLI